MIELLKNARVHDGLVKSEFGEDGEKTLHSE